MFGPGDLRLVLLSLIEEKPRHGYELIKELEQKFGGSYAPSPGSVYPTLQLLEDEGLVRSTERDGKRVYEIPEAGRAEAASRVEQDGGPPWEVAGRGTRPGREVRSEFAQLFHAFKQIAAVGSPEQIDRALTIVRDARRELYQLLASD
jgi:DNA-binding PadR family transcriptional regulator